jgi:hypothetical protein
MHSITFQIEHDRICTTNPVFEFLKYIWQRPRLCEAMRTGELL